jgi:hypothetical protein
MIFDEQKRAIDYRFLEVHPAFEKQTGIEQPKGRMMSEIDPRPETNIAGTLRPGRPKW